MTSAAPLAVAAAAASSADAGKTAIAEAGPKKRASKPKKWWKKLAESECDPISLEPLNSLAYAPWVCEEDGHSYYFDPVCLAAYMVSANHFINPLTRRPLERSECAHLDEHLFTHCRAAKTALRAFDLREERESRERQRGVHSG